MGQWNIIRFYFLTIILSPSLTASTIFSQKLVSYDENLKWFKNCLIIWKQFTFNSSKLNVTSYFEEMYPLFYDIHTSVYLDSPYLLKFAGNHSPGTINITQLPLDLPQYTKYSNCQLQFHEFFNGSWTPWILIRGESDPNFVIYHSNHLMTSQELPKLLSTRLSAFNYSGVPLYLDSVTGGLHLLCVQCQRDKSLFKINSVVHQMSDILFYWKRIQNKLNGLTFKLPAMGGEFPSCEQNLTIPLPFKLSSNQNVWSYPNLTLHFLMSHLPVFRLLT